MSCSNVAVMGERPWVICEPNITELLLEVSADRQRVKSRSARINESLWCDYMTIKWCLHQMLVVLSVLWPDPLFYVWDCVMNAVLITSVSLSIVYWNADDSSPLSLFFFSPEKEKGLKKRAKLHPQENGEKSENGLSRENEERRENGDGDSDNEPEEVREEVYSSYGNWSKKVMILWGWSCMAMFYENECVMLWIILMAMFYENKD